MDLALLQLNSIFCTLQLAGAAVYHVKGLGDNEELAIKVGQAIDLILACETVKLADGEDEELRQKALAFFNENCDYLVKLRKPCCEFYKVSHQKAESIYKFFDSNPDMFDNYPDFEWEDAEYILDIFSAVTDVAEYMVGLEATYCLLTVYDVDMGGFKNTQVYNNWIMPKAASTKEGVKNTPKTDGRNVVTPFKSKTKKGEIT